MLINLIETKEVLQPLVIFVVGMTVYSIFIFHFYKFVARKEIFRLNLRKHDGAKNAGFKRFMSALLYGFKFVFLFPIIAIFWMAVLTALLAFLSTEQSIQTILLISVAIIATTRISAYYDEELSVDLAKMLPFALLGVFVVNISYVHPAETVAKLAQIPSLFTPLVYYFAFMVLLELILHILRAMFGRKGPHTGKPQ